jgi:small multidrug resistance pump
MKGWLIMLLAIILEVAGTTCMKFSHGFETRLPTILMIAFYGFSFTCFTIALKYIDISIAYAVWSGLGTVLISGIGIFWLNESATPLKIFSIVLIIIGVISLNFSN